MKSKFWKSNRGANPGWSEGGVRAQDRRGFFRVQEIIDDLEAAVELLCNRNIRCRNETIYFLTCHKPGDQKNLHLTGERELMLILFFSSGMLGMLIFRPLSIVAGLCNRSSITDGQIDDNDCKQQKLVHKINTCSVDGPANCLFL